MILLMFTSIHCYKKLSLYYVVIVIVNFCRNFMRIILTELYLTIISYFEGLAVVGRLLIL